MNIFFYFLQSIPECIGLISLSLTLSRVPLRWGRVLIGAVMLSIVVYIIRALPVIFGLHLPISILLMFLLFVIFTHAKPSNIIIAIFSSFMILTLLEYVFNSTFFAVTRLDPQQLDAYEGLWAALGVAQSLVLIIIAMFMPKYFRPIEGAWKN